VAASILERGYPKAVVITDGYVLQLHDRAKGRERFAVFVSAA